MFIMQQKKNTAAEMKKRMDIPSLDITDNSR